MIETASDAGSLLKGFGALAFEGTLLVGAIALLLFGSVRRRRVMNRLFLGVLVLAAVLVPASGDGLFFFQQLWDDDLSRFVRLLVGFSLLLFLLYPSPLFRRGEFLFFLLTAAVSSCLLASCNHFLPAYLAFELSSISLYYLCGVDRKPGSLVTAIRLWVFGAFCSALMLFGIALIYGSAGTLYLGSPPISNHGLYGLGYYFLFAGVFFKIGILPMHFWIPATFRRTSPLTCGILSIIPKIGGLGFMARILTAMAGTEYLPLGEIILYFSLATVVGGVLLAISEKHLLAMASLFVVIQSGFVLPLLLDASSQDVFRSYMVVYVVLNAGIFLILDFLKTKSWYVHQLAGYGFSRPLLSFVFFFFLCGFIGIPPTGGFTAKLLLFSSIWNSWLDTGSIHFLVFFGGSLAAIVAGLLFYLRPAHFLFFRTGDEDSVSVSVSAPVLSWSRKMSVVFLALLLFFTFFHPLAPIEVLENLAPW